MDGELGEAIVGALKLARALWFFSRVRSMGSSGWLGLFAWFALSPQSSGHLYSSIDEHINALVNIKGGT